MLKRLLPLVIITSLTSGVAIGQMPDKKMDPMSAKIKVAMKSDKRTEKETQRDRNRMPVHTLKFLGVKEDMRVLELIPGGGWYTRLLGAALQEKGQLYVGVHTDRLKDILANDPALSNVKVVAKDAKLKYNETEEGYDFSNPAYGVDNLDAVLTFRNYHNLTFKGRMAMNKAAFDALKSGGIYGVVDHTRRHMQSNNDENGRRIDPVLAIKEIQDSGFEFIDYSDMHYRADDELRYEVGRKSVTGNTDRFTFLFKKPNQ
ncbi:MAG: class I SAM-dependent methyltransferase [Algicola sp.]|nr:class I SAM-dependent methyltransferase [Algicola sp.]